MAQHGKGSSAEDDDDKEAVSRGGNKPEMFAMLPSAGAARNDHEMTGLRAVRGSMTSDALQPARANGRLVRPTQGERNENDGRG